ncbi:MAG: hypothetical protein IKJ05_02875 [Oscillospiraceae bacterium]|nr:hypothetical protein [Oscillospiraceae bacterium]
MAYLPLNYDQINLIEGTYQPSQIKNNSASFDYWVRTLFQRASSNLIFGLPDFWQGDIANFWYYCMLRFGFVSIQDLTGKGKRGDELGMCFSPVNLSGINFYYQRTLAVLSNPTLDESFELEIGKDCALVCMTPDKMGIWDVIERYALLLSNLDNAINMSIINSKIPFILGGKTKAAIQTLKKIMDKVNSGQPAVFYDSRIQDDAQSKDTPFQFLKLLENPKQNYLTTDQLIDLHTILSDFDAEVGIPTIPYQKKERETSFESQSKLADGQARSLVWKRTINDSIKEVKKLYPDLQLSFRLRWEVDDNVTGKDNNDRPGNVAET